VTADILFERRGVAGIVTLNRPKALNALTHDMVAAMKAKLDEWAADPAVAAVIVRGEGERAFCAGGDIRAAAQSGRSGGGEAFAFWRDEYRLNAAIKHYPKPYLALTHGIVMGGGAGISVHGTYRVADGTTLFAMPETGIGFVPDVGGSFFLPRCPGEIGMYLALTGARIQAADMLYAGIATDFASAQDRDTLVEAVADGESPGNLLSKTTGGYVVRHPQEAPLAEHREKIDRIFSAGSVEEILARLDADDSDFARETASTIRAKSPTSLKLTFRLMRAGRAQSFEECQKMEYRVARRIFAGRDFYEGVRAALIDKDQSPRWQPPTLAEVGANDIDAYFAPLGEDEFSL
jgi:enoyl-CoA hydratase